MLIDKLKAAGVEVDLAGDDKLRVRARKRLTEEQSEFLEKSKRELRAELRSRQELPNHIKIKLQNVVAKIAADCVSWFRDDSDVIEQMNEQDLEKAVINFVGKRSWYLLGAKDRE